MGRSLIWVLGGGLVASVSWAPFWLWLTFTQNLHTTPVIFLFLAVAGTILGGVGALAGLVGFVVNALRALFIKR
jgi:hypothetical protein